MGQTTCNLFAINRVKTTRQCKQWNEINPTICYILGAYLGRSHEFLLQSAHHCDNDDWLVERIGILNNITKDGMPAGHGMIFYLTTIANLWDSANESRFRESTKQHDDLKLKVILWFGELCTCKECSHWIISSNLIEAIQNELIQV